MAHVPDSAQRNLDIGDHIWFGHWLRDPAGESTLQTRCQTIVRVSPTFVWYEINGYSVRQRRREDVYPTETALLASMLIATGQKLIREAERHEENQRERRQDIRVLEAALKRAQRRADA